MGIFLAMLLALVLSLPPDAVARSSNRAAANFNNKGVNLFVEKKYADAIDNFDQALKLDPNNSEAYSNRGACYDALDNPDRAAQDYTAAIALNPKFTQAYINRALAYSDLGQFDRSIEDWTVVIHRKPKDAFAYNKRGACYKSLGDLQMALKDFEKAVSLDRKDEQAAKNYELTKKAVQADVTLASADTKLPPLGLTDTLTSTTTGASLGTAGGTIAGGGITGATATEATPRRQTDIAASQLPRQSEATAAAQPTAAPQIHAQKNVSVQGMCANVMFHVVGNLLLACGQFDAAAANYGNAAAANPNDPFAFYRRGVANLKAGHKELALADFQSALNINERFTQARKHKDELLKQVPPPIPGPTERH